MLYRLLLGGLNSIRTPGHMKTGRPVPSGERPTYPRIVSQSIRCLPDEFCASGNGRGERLRARDWHLAMIV